MAVGRLAELFPLPFVAVVVLLVVLIFLTPNLMFGGTPAAGSLATQAQLRIDLPPGSETLHCYIEGLSPVRYAVIAARVATNVSWQPPPVVANLTWTNASYETGVLAAAFTVAGFPVAVNVTATYVDSGGTTVTYWGLYEFDVQGISLLTVPLAPNLPSVGATPLTSLPVTLLLPTSPPGVP